MSLNMNAAVNVRAKVDGLQSITGLEKGLKGVGDQAGATGGALGRLKAAGGAAASALRAIAPALTVAGMVAGTKSILDNADAMSKMSARTGASATSLDKFRQVAELNDTSIGSIGKGLRRLSTRMVEAQTGTGKSAEMFNRLGISVVDTNGKLKGSDEIMLELADRFKEMEDGPEKAALAAELLGRRLGSELIPMLNQGGDAVRNMKTAMTDEFADAAASFNDAITEIQQEFMVLATELVTTITPALLAFAGGLRDLVRAFNELPEPLQGIILSVGALTAAWLLLAPILTPIVALLKGLAALKIGAIIAGWAGAIGPIIATLGTLGKILLGVFTGPVGWVALAVAAGVAIYAFRDQIGEVFNAIGNIIKDAAAAFKSTFIDPIANMLQGFIENAQQKFNDFGNAVQSAFTAAWDFVRSTFIDPVTTGIQTWFDNTVQLFQRLPDAIKAPFEAVANTIRGIINQMLNGIGNAMNSVVRAINGLISGANAALARLNLPQIPFLNEVDIPQFAKGGVVTGPTLAMVGEGGEPEYIVPQSKAAGFAANWSAGRRGAAAIPAFAEGGVVMPSTAQVSIQTGPVTQMNGSQFVTTQDLSSAVQSGVEQTLALLRNDTSTRRAVGIA
jgi:phage-related protein